MKNIIAFVGGVMLVAGTLAGCDSWYASQYATRPPEAAQTRAVPKDPYANARPLMRAQAQWDAEDERAGRLPPTKPTPHASVASSSYSLGGGHWIDDVFSDGEFIKLEDGSLWEVHPGYHADAFSEVCT